MFTRFLSFLFFFIFLFGCNPVGKQIDELRIEIDRIESKVASKEVPSTSEWSILAEKMERLTQDIAMNKDDYSSSQISDFKDLEGRYSKLLARKAGLEIGTELIDGIEKVKGFVEGIKEAITADSIEKSSGK